MLADRVTTIGGILSDGVGLRNEVIKRYARIPRLLELGLVLFEVMLVYLNIGINKVLDYVTELKVT